MYETRGAPITPFPPWVCAVAQVCAHPLEAGTMRDVAGKLEEKAVVGVASAVVSVAHMTDQYVRLHDR